MQQILYILQISPEDVNKLLDRLKRDRFEPSYLPEYNQIPSNYIHISLIITITSRSKLSIAQRVFTEHHGTIIEGPQDIEPDWKFKLKRHVGYVWKETVLILVEGWAAIHVAILIFVLHNNIPLDIAQFTHLEIFGIGSLPAFGYFIHSKRKYEKII